MNDRDRRITDGGSETEAGADDLALDPWGSSTISDYRNLFAEFGIEEFEAVLPDVPNPHYLMRRGVIFGHRDYDPVANAMSNNEPFAALSGFMPTGDPHIGHKLVFDELIWHQEQGADAYGLIADLEAHSARGISWAEIDEHARNYLLSLLALGFDPEDGELYRQADNKTVRDLAFELGSRANISEFQAIYGFENDTSISHMQSVITQMADILYPQLDEPKPTVIPVGPDQDPHVRFSRDLAARLRYFGITEAYASFEVDPEELALLREVFAALKNDAVTSNEQPSGEDGDSNGDTGSSGDTDSGDYSGSNSNTNSGDDSGSNSDINSGDNLGRGSDLNSRDDDETLRCNDAAEWLEATRSDVPAANSLLEKLRAAGKEPLRPRVRFLDRNATDEAFEALIAAIEGDKRVFDEHVDSFDLSVDEAESLARSIEIDHGGYGFMAPSSIYHRFMTGLTGGKMSSSIPASHISLLDDPQAGYEKVKSATTGGRETAEKQRELGGEADECPVYELYAYLLAGDDDEFATRVYEECVGGDRLCGDCKEQAAQLMSEFLADHQEKRAEAAELLDDLDIELDAERRGVPGDDH